MIFVYCVLNTVNNKYYIGQSKDIKRRWRVHSTGKGSKLLAKAITLYGLESFKFFIIDKTNQQEIADMLEENYIKQYNSLSPNGYNLAPSATKARVSRIPNEVQQSIINAYLNNIPVKDISKLFNYSVGAIVKTLKRHNIQTRKPITKRYKSKIDKQILVELLKQDKSTAEIAKYFRTNYKYIWKYIKTHNIEEYNTKPKRDRQSQD